MNHIMLLICAFIFYFLLNKCSRVVFVLQALPGLLAVFQRTLVALCRLQQHRRHSKLQAFGLFKHTTILPGAGGSDCSQRHM